MKLRDNPKLQLEIKDSINKLKEWLNKLDFWIKENRDKILKLINNVVSFEDEVVDLWEKHDYVNWTLFLKEIQWDIDEIWKDEALEYFWYWEEKLRSLSEAKDNFSINEIKDLLVLLSKTENVDIDFNIDEKNIKIKDWIIKNANNWLFFWYTILKNELDKKRWWIKNIFNKFFRNKDLYKDLDFKDFCIDIYYENKINFELWRLFQNLIKNSKEAWANNIKISISEWIISMIVKYLDNWSWMNDDIILNKMFIKWESTKKDSWKNLWIWMNWIAWLMGEKWVNVDIYSQTNGWYFAKWFIFSAFKWISEWGSLKEWYADLNNKKYHWETWEFPNETWTEFVFKFPKKQLI